MHVLMLSPFFRPNLGGQETHLNDLCEYLTSSEHQIDVITYLPLTTNVWARVFETSGNLRIRRIPWFGRGLFFKLEPHPELEFLYLAPAMLFCSLIFMLRYGKRIDVIHAHGLNAAFVAKLLSKILRKRYVVSLHTIYELSKKPRLARLVKMVLSSSDIVLVLSKRLERELNVIGLHGKTRVFTYWVNQSIFKLINKEKCKKELGWNGEFIVLFVGRFLEVKGVRLLLEAAQRLSCFNRVSFAFIGNGPLVEEVKNASKSIKNMIYVGAVENRKLNLHYNAADMVIVPSLSEEGFGRVILEALSCGTPVVASKRGGIPEALHPSVGILIEPTVDEIVGKIRYFCENQDSLLNLARNCRKYAEERFSERNAEIIEEGYRIASSHSS